MKSIQDLLPSTIKTSKSRQSEYGDLLNYFFGLGLKDKQGRAVSIGYIGMLCAPLIRGVKGDRNYSLLYELKAKCEKSDTPAMIAWAYLKPKKK